jgi:ribosome biogenesis protein ENP2
MIFAPVEKEKIGTFFIPELGHAPKWCAFLENLTEELEESNASTVYDDFKFVTAADLEKLNASHLIGTPILKAYMHGYFMELGAYQKLKRLADPFAMEKFKQEQIEKRLQKQRERIQVVKKPANPNVKVNQQFVDNLLIQHEKNKKSADVKKMLSDDRFKSMFEDKEFARDVDGAKVSNLYLLTFCSEMLPRRAKKKNQFQMVRIMLKQRT